MLFGTKTNKQLDTVRIVTTYSNNHRMVRETIGRRLHLLTGDPILKVVVNPPKKTCKTKAIMS